MPLERTNRYGSHSVGDKGGLAVFLGLGSFRLSYRVRQTGAFAHTSRKPKIPRSERKRHP